MPGSSSNLLRPAAADGSMPVAHLWLGLSLGTCENSYCRPWGPQSMQSTHIGPSLYVHRESFSKTDSQIPAITATGYTEKDHPVHLQQKQTAFKEATFMHAAHAALIRVGLRACSYAAHLFPLCLLLPAGCRQRGESLFRKAGPIHTKVIDEGFPVWRMSRAHVAIRYFLGGFTSCGESEHLRSARPTGRAHALWVRVA
ncbi:hypothetical protein HDV63DRAFT_367537 [Trichoderma sp. SZMC 28014]